MSKFKFNPVEDLGATFGFLTLRIWLAVRAIQTGIEKYAGMGVETSPAIVDGAPNTSGLMAANMQKVYGLDHYHGVPEAMYDKFVNEPLIPDFFLNIYDTVLGPALIILGFTLLIGLATRVSLFLMGLLYTSLTFGLILLKQDAGIAWLGVHIILIAMALFNVKHNRLSVLNKW